MLNIDEVRAENGSDYTGNIFDDVEIIKTKVANLENAVLQLQECVSVVNVITENTDLNTLDVGDYLIPNAAVCGTITNKPVGAGTYTAVIKVLSGGDGGQKIMYYIPCSKTLMEYYRRDYYQNAWGNWNVVNNADSGWIDLPLADGITGYSEEQKPRYRRIGKEVFLSGVLRGVTSTDKVVATLPAGYRPNKKVMLAVPSVGQMITKMTINTNGTIVLNRFTIEPVSSENWHSIACNFSVE